MEPQLVRRTIIAGTGPAGGEGISKVARATYLDIARGLLTHQDPKQFLFFTRTPGGSRAGKESLARLKERSQNRDKEATVTVLQAQVKALRRWGSKAPADLSKIHHPRRCALLIVGRSGDRFRVRTLSQTPEILRQHRNSRGTLRRTSILRHAVDRNCVGGIWRASARAAGVDFQQIIAHDFAAIPR